MFIQQSNFFISNERPEKCRSWNQSFLLEKLLKQLRDYLNSGKLIFFLSSANYCSSDAARLFLAAYGGWKTAHPERRGSHLFFEGLPTRKHSWLSGQLCKRSHPIPLPNLPAALEKWMETEEESPSVFPSLMLPHLAAPTDFFSVYLRFQSQVTLKTS